MIRERREIFKFVKKEFVRTLKELSEQEAQYLEELKRREGEFKELVRNVLDFLPDYLHNSLDVFSRSITSALRNFKIAIERFNFAINLSKEAALNAEGVEIIDGVKAAELRELSSKSLRVTNPVLNAPSTS